MEKTIVEKIVMIDDTEYSHNEEIAQKYVIVTTGDVVIIKNTDLSEVCIYNNGACLITHIGGLTEDEIDSSNLDIPTSVGFIKPYDEAKKFFAEIGYESTSKVEVHREVDIYKDGGIAFSTVVVEYYKALNPDDAWKLFDEKGTLL